MKISFLLESIIYFACIYIISIHILNYKTQKERFIYATCIHSGILFVSCFLEYKFFNILLLIFPILQILMLYFVFINAKMRTIIYTYAFIYSCITIFTLVISIMFHQRFDNALFIEMIIYCIFATLCILCCYKFHVLLKQIVNWTPALAKRILLLLLMLDMFLLALVFDNQYFSNSTVWFQFVQNTAILTVILLLIITGFLVCIMLSNNKLKQLTANYEQQIVAQAEH